MQFLTTLIGLSILVLTAVVTPAEARRVALIVGNSAYTQVPVLPNAANDMRAVAEALKGLGFEVEAAANLTADAFRRRLGAFEAKANGAEIALIYYAGHGIEVDGENYVVPVDARLASATAVELEAISLTTAKNVILGASKLRLVILDACRNNPFRARMVADVGGRKRSIGRGLARVEPGDNELVVFAAAAGTEADDGTGNNSPFTTALLKHIATPGVDIRLMLGGVRDDVLAGTSRRQQPHVYGTLGREPIYLAAAVPTAPAPPPSGDEGIADLVVAIEGMSERRRLEVFAKHSNAIVAKAATTRLGALAAVTTPMPAPASPTFPSFHDAIAALKPGSGKGARDKLKEGGECGFCPEMVVVPAGFFVMGSPAREEGRTSDEGPLRTVTFARPFAVGRHPVTRGQFRAFLMDTKRATGKCGYEGWEAPGFPQDDRHPVVCVNWDDAAYFAVWLSGRTGQTYRLLSEAEREYVTRAGTVSHYHFGNRITEKQANFQVDFHSKKSGTTPIGSFPANAWGLHDVHGNVSEWVQDVAHDNYDGAPTDGSAWISGDASRRVIRGGSWSNGSYSLRSAHRGRESNDDRNNNLGFRVARTLSATAQ